ncbi:MAG: hypothetical protein KA158_07165, partial [Leucobacter sp.]|nr:hypothetical protein [Leucobacter sp.]
MPKTSARILGGGLVAALIAMGSITAAATTAQAVTFDVTASGDEGPGTLGAAIEAANASPGADTIRIADGQKITVTQSFSITETVTIVGGEGSAIVNMPNYRGAVLNATGGATVNLQDIAFEGKAAYGSFVRVGPTSEPTTIENLTISNVDIGSEAASFLHFEDAGGAITVNNGRFTDTQATTLYDLALLRIDRLAAPLHVKNTVFYKNTPVGISIGSSELPQDASILIEDSKFEFVAAAIVSTLPAAAIHIEGGANQPAGRTTPALLLRNTPIISSANSTAGAVRITDLLGDVIFEETSIVNNGSASGEVQVELNGHRGRFELLGSTVDAEKGTNGPAHSVRFTAGEAPGDAPSAVRIVDSTFTAPFPAGKPHVIVEGDVGVEVDHATFVGGGIGISDPTSTSPVTLTNSIVSK